MSSPEKEQPLRAHLEELRRRLFIAALALVVGTAVAFVFHRQVLQVLIRPAAGTTFIFTEVTEMLGISMKVSIMGGLILALPVIAYEVLMFVSPALTTKERRLIFLLVPGIVLAFVGGVAFGYFVLIPPGLRFLLNFDTDIATPMIRMGNYVDFVVRLLFWIGVVFESPIFMATLARLGVVTYKTFAKWRRLAIVLAFVLSAAITPTFDPVNQTLVAVPIMILYEVGIWLAWLTRRSKKPS